MNETPDESIDRLRSALRQRGPITKEEQDSIRNNQGLTNEALAAANGFHSGPIDDSDHDLQFRRNPPEGNSIAGLLLPVLLLLSFLIGCGVGAIILYLITK